jgi:hypothetical protein
MKYVYGTLQPEDRIDSVTAMIDNAERSVYGKNDLKANG